MPRPRRRVKTYTGGITPDMELAILFGAPSRFTEAEIKTAWRDFGDQIVAGPGLVPWAAMRFDGATGHSSPYCALGDTCGCGHPEGLPVWSALRS